MSKDAMLDAFEGSAELLAEIARREAVGSDFSALRGATAAMIDIYHPKIMDLVVDDVLVETMSSKTFSLRRQNGADLPPFLAGQYVNLFVTVGDLQTSRPYAISSGSKDRSRYELTIRRVPEGLVSNHLLDTLKRGDRLQSTGPMGTFFHNPLFHGEDLVFIAGGSGVAPAMSMIRDIVESDRPLRLHLIYGSTSAQDILFKTELDTIAASHSNIRVAYVVMEPDVQWRGLTGLISAELIESLTGPLNNRMVYVCGPQALYPYALEQLSALGHKRRRIRFEANGAPAQPQAQADWPAGLSPATRVSVQVNGGPTFKTSCGTPLLDALEGAGVHPPVACRSGECGLCRVRVVAGDVFSAHEAHLRKADVQFGYVHSCVSYALGDLEIEL